MGNSCGCMRHPPKLKVVDPGCGMGESSVVLENVSAHALESEHGSLSCESFLSANCESIVGSMKEELVECGERGMEEEIERSKAHWSLLADLVESGEIDEGVVAEVDNLEVFKSLQVDPIWGGFYATFGHDMGGTQRSSGELVVGERFAEGAQAELYHAQVTWKDAGMKEWDLEHGREWAVKVYKEGTYLRELHKALPRGFLQYFVEQQENLGYATPRQVPRYYAQVFRGILLENGRFAFLIKKEHFDLRDLIDRNQKLQTNEGCGPFSHDEAEWFMYMVAAGLEWLHEHDIVHRDMKASNVLVKELKSGWPKWVCYICDYECSVGVVGTGFFRAPEILQELLQARKDPKVGVSPKVFSKAADVYSYGMVCYEILTGKLPFEGHPTHEYDRVLEGPQLLLPEEVDDWKRELLSRFWQSDPRARPTMRYIVNKFLDHCPELQNYDEET